MHPDLPLDQILIGDCRELLKTLPDASVHCVVTSPPYWGLRSYGTDPQVWQNGHEPCVEHQWGEAEHVKKSGGTKGLPYELNKWIDRTTNTCSICGAWRGELGLEPTPELYVEHITQIFREVKRVLRDDGTIWINLGDSYASTKVGNTNEAPDKKPRPYFENGTHLMDFKKQLPPGLKPKDLVGIPWMVAFALRADGWYLRSDIIWAKPNPMPESVTDRPTKAHEYIFLLSKSQRYYYDSEAIREPETESTKSRNHYNRATPRSAELHHGKGFLTTPADKIQDGRGRNRRTVWTVATHPFKGAHFATFPPKLIEPCILAGTSERGVCPKCGAPWERVIEKRLTGEILADGSIKQTKMSRRARADGSEIKSATSVFKTGMWNESNTVGWRPTCDCDAGEPVPAVVLDPFMGSGTTASVCISLKRHYIGFDLNPAYVEDIAQDRADNTPPPLFVL